MSFHGFDVYKCYLAMKLHFSKPEFDYFVYEGKVRANETTYQQRNDFYFFETIARNYTRQETMEFLLATFVASKDPTKVWIGDIKRNGKANLLVFKKLHEGLSYFVEQDCKRLVEHMEEKGLTFNDLLSTLGSSPPLLSLYIRGDIKLETMIVMDICLGFMKKWDSDLYNPMWESVSFKVSKYKGFLSLNKTKYLKLLRSIFL